MNTRTCELPNLFMWGGSGGKICLSQWPLYCLLSSLSLVHSSQENEGGNYRALIFRKRRQSQCSFTPSDETLCWQTLKASRSELLKKNDLMLHHQIKVLSTIPWFHNFSFCLVANYRLIKLGIAGKAVKGRKCTSVQISHFTCGEMKVLLHCTCADRVFWVQLLAYEI